MSQTPYSTPFQSEPIHRTIAKPLSFQGLGIHTAAPSAVRLEPAAAGDGIVLVMEGTDWPELPAQARYAVAEECDRRTVLRGPQGQCFQQLEHLMAALAAAEVTDARVIQSGPEPPFLDGGCRDYLQGILEAGTRALGEQIDPIVVQRPICLTDGEAELVATPHDGLRLTSFVEFPGTIVGSMGASVQVSPERFLHEVAAARTFALERDIEMLRQAGLAKGGNLDNAVVFNEDSYLNSTLNYPDEVARHKIIDLLGDLALLGRPLRGHFWAWRAGHRSHVRFAQTLLQETNRDV